MRRVYLEGVPHSLKNLDICEYKKGLFGVYADGESNPHMIIADPEMDISRLRQEFSDNLN
jgi:hypothetical protein